MVVRAGYKQTEVGIIPEDWIVKPLGEIGKFKNGINKAKVEFGHGFPFVNLMDVFGIPSIDVTSNLGLINSKKIERDLYSLHQGDVLFVRSSVKPEGVGLTTIIQNDLPDTVFSGFLIRFRETDTFLFEYKKNCFNQDNFRKRLIASSTVSANTNINQDALKGLYFSYPPNKAEQHAIAAALSDVDAHISSLEQVIAKKSDLKQAAMQELLTGKRRLPEFSKEKEYKKTDAGVIPMDWDIDSIGNISSITTGDKNTQDRIDDGVFPFFVRSSTIEHINSYSFDGEAVLTAGDGVGTGKIFHYIKGKFDFHQRVYKISDFCERIDGYYFYLYFSNHFYSRIMQMTAKSSVDSVRREMISKMDIPLPPPPEQRAIATVLSDMDAELAALEQKRNKTKAIKQGMMQELLTGRIRLT